MRKLLGVSDAAAISLSLICAVHCLIFPLLMVLIPTMASSMADESFHRWMVIAVVPVSAFSLLMGCKRHKRYFAIITGSIGLLLLIFTGYFAEGVLDELWEENVTLLAAALIAIGHFYNFRSCQVYCWNKSSDVS